MELHVFAQNATRYKIPGLCVGAGPGVFSPLMNEPPGGICLSLPNWNFKQKYRSPSVPLLNIPQPKTQRAKHLALNKAPKFQARKAPQKPSHKAPKF